MLSLGFILIHEIYVFGDLQGVLAVYGTLTRSTLTKAGESMCEHEFVLADEPSSLGSKEDCTIIPRGGSRLCYCSTQNPWCAIFKVRLTRWRDHDIQILDWLAQSHNKQSHNKFDDGITTSETLEKNMGFHAAARHWQFNFIKWMSIYN